MKKLASAFLCLLMLGCVSMEEIQRQNESEARMTPKERCEKYVDDMASSCSLLCLSQIVSNNPNGQSCLNQCGQNKLSNYQYCTNR